MTIKPTKIWWTISAMVQDEKKTSRDSSALVLFSRESKTHQILKPFCFFFQGKAKPFRSLSCLEHSKKNLTQRVSESPRLEAPWQTHLLQGVRKNEITWPTVVLLLANNANTNVIFIMCSFPTASSSPCSRYLISQFYRRSCCSTRV